MEEKIIEIPFGTDSELIEETITIPNGCYAVIEDNKVIFRKGEQKPTWSEEDEKMFRSIRCYLNEFGNWLSSKNEEKSLSVYKACDWLKSLKGRYTWKPSEEQIKTLYDAIVYVKGCNSNFKGNGSVLEKLYNYLKKLREE